MSRNDAVRLLVEPAREDSLLETVPLGVAREGEHRLGSQEEPVGRERPAVELDLLCSAECDQRLENLLQTPSPSALICAATAIAATSVDVPPPFSRRGM